MINTIIIDDEPLAVEILESFVSRVPNLNLVAKCSNAFEANTILKEKKIDLMLLDIQMPQLNGVEFLKSLRNPPSVIFTTAYPNFAVEGFELDAIDYLLKPISMDRFMKAINKAEDRIDKRKTSIEEVSDIDYFFVKADKKLVKIKFSDIVYIEGLKDYVMIKKSAARIITLQTMKSLEAKLGEHNFKRIHRSFIVNLDKIIAIDGNTVEVMEKGQIKRLPIGKNYRDDLLAMINDKKL